VTGTVTRHTTGTVFNGIWASAPLSRAAQPSRNFFDETRRIDVTDIQAIPTRYAGCHFRSRLEARWAVAFDSLGIRWEYERQGYLCSQRLSFGEEPEPIPYLPDFWLPDLKLHGEVKGQLTDAELLRLLNCAASLSSNDRGGCGFDNQGSNLVVFGNIPPGSHDTDRLPTELHMHKGNLIASPWIGDQGQCLGYGHTPAELVAQDVGGSLEQILVAEDWHNAGRLTPARLAQWLTRGSWGSRLGWDERFRQWWVAYDAAKSARFEHGENGPT
jgi:hypothetical protein